MIWFAGLSAVVSALLWLWSRNLERRFDAIGATSAVAAGAMLVRAVSFILGAVAIVLVVLALLG